MNILIVEDDKTLSGHMKQAFTKQGFAASVTSRVEAAREALEVNRYDCVVLDLNLPDGDGFSLLNKLRQEKDQTPVIILTARGDTQERVKGLNMGADDYVVKPVNTDELIARARAVIRRASETPLPAVTVGPLTLISAKQQAGVNDEALDLTTKEFSVLEYLAQNHGQVVTRTMIMEHVWGSDFDVFSNVVDVYIRNLRREIERHASKRLIHTVRGKGYVLKHETDDH